MGTNGPPDPEQFITPGEAQQHLSALQKAVDDMDLSGSSEYDRFQIQNQLLNAELNYEILRLLGESVPKDTDFGGGIGGDGGGDSGDGSSTPGGVGEAVTKGDIPVGMRGIAAHRIPQESVGTVVFWLWGSVVAVQMETRTKGVSSGSVVEVVSSGIIGPADRVLMGAGGAGATGGGGLNVFGQDQPVFVGNQEYDTGNYVDIDATIDPNEDKEMARVDPNDANTFYLRAVSMSQHSSIRYDVYVDSEDEPYQPLSGGTPPATPPDWYEPVEDGYIRVDDFISIHMVETQGNSYSSAEAKIDGVIEFA